MEVEVDKEVPVILIMMVDLVDLVEVVDHKQVQLQLNLVDLLLL